MLPELKLHVVCAGSGRIGAASGPRRGPVKRYQTGYWGQNTLLRQLKYIDGRWFPEMPFVESDAPTASERSHDRDYPGFYSAEFEADPCSYASKSPGSHSNATQRRSSVLKRMALARPVLSTDRFCAVIPTRSANVFRRIFRRASMTSMFTTMGIKFSVRP